MAGVAAYWTCGVNWAAAATAGMTETAVAHCRLGDNTCGALAGVCGSVGLRLIAIDEMVMAFFKTFGWGVLISCRLSMCNFGRAHIHYVSVCVCFAGMQTNLKRYALSYTN